MGPQCKLLPLYLKSSFQQILREDLVKKMVQHGVIANIQPQFVPTDACWAEKMLPPDLLEYAYAWKTILHAGR